MEQRNTQKTLQRIPKRQSILSSSQIKNTAQKEKLFFENVFGKCEQICTYLNIC